MYNIIGSISLKYGNSTDETIRFVFAISSDIEIPYGEWLTTEEIGQLLGGN